MEHKGHNCRLNLPRAVSDRSKASVYESQSWHGLNGADRSTFGESDMLSSMRSTNLDRQDCPCRRHTNVPDRYLKNGKNDCLFSNLTLNPYRLPEDRFVTNLQ
jgi:hypothetical protein